MIEAPIVVYHVAAMGDWQDVVREQLVMFRDSGLGVDEPLRVTFVGRGLDWFTDAARQAGVRVEVVKADTNTDHYETFAMLEIERLAKLERVERPILYVHTKGVSNAGDMHKRRWRLLMEDYTVRAWRENVRILATGKHDAVGVNWWGRGEQHFSGNIWMATPEWIRRLPNYVAYHHAKNLTRYSCEMWIGAANHCRAFSHLTRDQMFWVGGYDLRPYRRALPTHPLPELAPGERLDRRPVLSVVTACSRPANLPIVAASLNSLRPYYDVCWIIVLDASKVRPDEVASAAAEWRECVVVMSAPHDPTLCGITQKNAGLERALFRNPEGWVYFCDDDNAVHPQLGEITTRARLEYPRADALVFAQVDAAGQHRLDAGPIQWGKIDTGSLFMRGPVLRTARYTPHPDPEKTGDDYMFARAVWDEFWDRFCFVPEPVTYYNKLPSCIRPHGCPVPLLQDEWEWEFLLREVCFLSPRRIVEIGSFYGGSLWHWLRMIPSSEHVVSIDLAPDPAAAWYDLAAHGEYRRRCQERWQDWTEGKRLTVFSEDSHRPEFPARVQEAFGNEAQPVDMLVIDGDHSEAGTLEDWRRYSPLVRPGGVVVLHDIAGIDSVRKVWARIALRHRTAELVSKNRRMGIGIVYL